MSLPLSLAAGLGALRLLKAGTINGDFSSCGVTEKDYELLTSSTPWMAQQRNAVRNTMEALIWGSMDIAGVPRFQPPAEYIAAVISEFVGAPNKLVACRYIEGGSRTEELAAGATQETDPVTSRQLFALVVQLEAHSPHVRDSFEKKVGLAIDRSAEQDGEVRETKGQGKSR
ncbi:putative minor capsid protein [Eel River basin pequenovirus]|nr:putative minor capsid protein [Eel River basin pequenovirus]